MNDDKTQGWTVVSFADILAAIIRWRVLALVGFLAVVAVALALFFLSAPAADAFTAETRIQTRLIPGSIRSDIDVNVPVLLQEILTSPETIEQALAAAGSIQDAGEALRAGQVSTRYTQSSGVVVLVTTAGSDKAAEAANRTVLEAASAELESRILSRAQAAIELYENTLSARTDLLVDIVQRMQPGSEAGVEASRLTYSLLDSYDLLNQIETAKQLARNPGVQIVPSTRTTVSRIPGDPGFRSPPRMVLLVLGGLFLVLILVFVAEYIRTLRQDPASMAKLRAAARGSKSGDSPRA